MQSAGSLARELKETRILLAQLTEEAERNSEILARSHARELSLLQAESLPALFHVMLSQLRDSYRLDAVTVVLCDPDHDVRHLLLAEGTLSEPPPGLIFVDRLTDISPGYTGLAAPWLGPYNDVDHLSVFPALEGIESVALIPLLEKGRLFGSVNFASYDPSRFSADQATDFLDHLGTIASFALENSVNRARLLRSGFTDVLTGWYNRRYLQVRLVEELARARRQGASLTCLMLDIDFFKRINDAHGHAAGDIVLREIAEQIESRIRATDVAARYGGEEFIILLPDTHADAGALLAEQVRAGIADSLFGVDRGLELSVTVSIGVACTRPDRSEVDFKRAGDALIARADVALYEAKSGGRNRVEINAGG